MRGAAGSSSWPSSGGEHVEKCMSITSSMSSKESGRSKSSKGSMHQPTSHSTWMGASRTHTTVVLQPVPEESDESTCCDGARERLWALLRLDWLVRAFNRRTGVPAGARSRSLWIKAVFTAWVAVGVFSFYQLRLVPQVASSSEDAQMVFTVRVSLLLVLWVILSLLLVLTYVLGYRTCVKVIAAAMWTAWILVACTVIKEVPSYLGVILVLDHLVLVSDKNKDAGIMRKTAMAIMLVYFAYTGLRVFVEERRQRGEMGWSIYMFEEQEGAVKYPAAAVWVVHVLPIVCNYVLLQGYANSAAEEAEAMARSVEMAHLVAEKLAKYQLQEAEKLLSSRSLWSTGRRSSREMTRPFKHLLRNLVSYRAFLPDALFVKEVDPDSADARTSPNPLLLNSMKSQKTSWMVVENCVTSLREPGYNLAAFKDDVEKAFPELALYTMGGHNETGRTSSMSSGRNPAEELERTMGALYAVYCIARLDMDGKEVFSFGVDERGNPLAEPSGEKAEAKAAFWSAMSWGSLWELFVRAELLREECGHFVVNRERMMGFLVLTVLHDIMKNTALLPTVQPQHSPYRGVQEGETISDHDMALAYIMERFPWLLPSYRELAPAQRAPILFTQGTMSFNNGWLVQGEAPPGLLFSSFKQVIVQGRASEADVAFYFAHWLTDLAGAEPYNDAPWPGAEKFTSKFPLRVLRAFLDSFSFVDHLVGSSEVEVMESYLQSRWVQLDMGVGPSADLRVAAMRVALMAQGFERDAVESLMSLPHEERSILAIELARTGCKTQFQLSPAVLRDVNAGPAICVYYSPALVQKSGRDEVYKGLLCLAAIFRAARELFPLDVRDALQTVVVRIDQMKSCSPHVIHELGPWVLQRTGGTDAKATRQVDFEGEQQQQQFCANSLTTQGTTESQATSRDAKPPAVGAKSIIPARPHRIDWVPIRLSEYFCMDESVDLGGL